MSVHGTAASEKALRDALAALGRDASLRDELLGLLRRAEARLATPGLDVRTLVTGPIADAACAEAGELRLVLADGLVYDFDYTSRIARSIVLRPEVRPDYVWEPQTTRLLVHLATGARHVLVGGAYAGDQALLLARHIAMDGGVCHAFEPNPRQAKRLEQNAGTNGLKNIRVDRRALWRESGVHLTLIGCDSDAYSVPVDELGVSDDEASMVSVTIDEYATEASIDRLDLIMLDVEGAEHSALQGARRFLEAPTADAPHLVFEVHREYVDWSHGLGATPIVRELRDAGYTCFAVRDFHATVPMGARPIELIEPERTVLEGPPHGFNMVAVKNVAILDGDQFVFVADVSPKLLWHKDPALHHPLIDRATHGI